MPEVAVLDESQVATATRPAPCRWLTRIFVTVLALLIAGGLYFGYRLSLDRPERFADPVMQFKYGSTGGDKNFGMPFAVWQALPILFKDKLPEGREEEGWGAFGFITEERPADAKEWPRHDRPTGTTMRNFMGIERIFLNCAGCHAGSVRGSPGAAAMIVPGMPSNTVNLQAFQEFLIAAALDERFTPERIIAQIDASNIELDWINRLALKFIGMYQIRERLLTIGNRFRFSNHEPAFGPGRFDTFSPAKALLNWPLDKLPEHERIGVVDFPSIWLQEKKRGLQLHWDGNNTKVEERNRSAAFGTGATPPTLDRASIRQVEDWLLHAAPPTMEDVLKIKIDAAKAERGKAIYVENCASCHGMSGRDFSVPSGAANGVGKVTPIGEIGTDRFRLDNYTYDLSIAQNTLYAGNAEERFQNFRKTNGYANAPLDGLWLRAPYLHNGSVPTLRDLLKPAADRPIMFYSGYDVYDPVNVGFVSQPERVPATVKARLFCFATTKAGEAQCEANKPRNNGVCDAGPCKGNGNGGHEYGTALRDDEKDDLIEYLKTF